MDELPAPFGKYYLIEKIATGGMAEIYLAKLIGPGGFEKALIIKQIHPELFGDPQFVDMFVTEAKILVSLSHGNIVPVYELGVVDDTYFIAMEYIDGPTLRVLQKALARTGERMAPALAVFIVAKVLEGLDYAHRKGVIHRDLSPRNVMVSREGDIKLVDFGIALREEHRQGAKGKLVGSYPYMSPEQVRGQELTPRSDIFAAGILLWELFTQERLFKRDDSDDTLRAVTGAAIVPPSHYHPELPDEIDRVCLRALERDPSARFETAGRFLAALNRYLYSGEQSATALDLSQLVARHCPPEIERPNERAASVGAALGAAEAAGPARPAGVEGERTVPIAKRGQPSSPGSESDEHTRPLARAKLDTPGEHTRPLAGRARGKRAPTVRTFATRREFKEILERATPLMPLSALTEADVPEPTATHTTADADADADADAGAAADAGSAPAVGPGSRARLRWRVAGLVVGLVVVSSLAVVWFGRRGSSPRADQTARSSADRALDAAPRVAVASAFDAADGPHDDPRDGPRDAEVSARLTRDIAGDSGNGALPAAVSRVHSGSKDTRDAAPDAMPTRVLRDPADAAVGQAYGTLKVGANPWAEVHVDGRLLGRAPNSWPLPLGPHTVEVVFPVPGHEQRQRFPVDIQSGVETSLGVIDFTSNPSNQDIEP